MDKTKELENRIKVLETLVLNGGSNQFQNNVYNAFCKAVETTKGVGIGKIFSPSSSAIFNVDSSSKGVVFPRMTTAQKNAISNPIDGLIVFDTSLASYYYYKSAAWHAF